MESASSDKYSKDKKKSEFTKNDLLLLTKARLSFLVIVTAVVGFIVAAKSTENSTDWWLLFHTVIGCAFAAAASSIFNQLMEIDIDAKMSRTSDRPLPAKKINPTLAFGLGWVFAAIGLVHLAVKVNPLSCAFAGATLFVYMFVIFLTHYFHIILTLFVFGSRVMCLFRTGVIFNLQATASAADLSETR